MLFHAYRKVGTIFFDADASSKLSGSDFAIAKVHTAQPRDDDIALYSKLFTINFLNSEF